MFSLPLTTRVELAATILRIKRLESMLDEVRFRDATCHFQES